VSAYRELLHGALERRRALGLPSADTTCYRLVHGEGDGLSGFTVDVYGEWLVASVYEEGPQPRALTAKGDESQPAGELEALTSGNMEAFLDALAALPFRGVYVKNRPRQANQLAAEERTLRCPSGAVRGESAPEAFVVHESAMPFEVRLGDGLSTGLFLDQRDNRKRLRAAAPDKRVLNLFAYTCAFGVAAALGGARSTTNLDVAKPVLERGKRNYALAGLALAGHTFLARDALEALPRMARRGESFDLVVLDPPSYASTKGRRFSVERDYAELVALAASVLAPGGELLACTNHQRLAVGDLVRAVRKGALQAGRAVRDLSEWAPPADHPPASGRSPHLKSAWVRF
jgi:23S rRNA (cytosine1962-C5)-methyltransferase